MKLLQLPLLCLAVPQVVFGATVTGRFVGGGGVDDMQVVVQTAAGQKVQAYCDAKCGDWFEEEPGSEVQRLKQSFRGKGVVLDYAIEPNRKRIAGLGDNERLPFVKKIQVLP